MTTTSQSLRAAVLDLVASLLNLDRQLLSPELTIEDLGLDSLDVLKVTHALEKQFRINLSAYSHQDVSSLGRLSEILEYELGKLGLKT
ncbi:hypothetical protein BI347_08130 [Chromobacterium sphagni]|uniref:Carrier domain-containing protein n=1 Tax=Chromobacterium sphagni TaxID=1903179 RepID=A0A1S1X1R5_9NEIS|nr:phosphopantetheine-binding protein [Chromobacterium sphagni]OHX13483.1 hypothetical protein BI347_08130 [Chromobacterium sphagni]